jgi:hypothetical protein
VLGKHELDQPPEPHRAEEWALKAREPTCVNPMGYVGPTRSASFRTDVNNVVTRFGPPLDYDPVVLRKPFRPHLAVDALPSGVPLEVAAGSPWLCPAFAFVPV